LLIKILDARDKLSLQVHPPPGGRGEPKTELWYIAHAGARAELYAGLKRGVTRGEFEKKISSDAITACFHRVPVRAGDAMFLPSGRVHALGADIVLFEIQQNSDTTYRVFDWNRLGTDGRPRELHVAQSLASIDFQDFEPGLVSARLSGTDSLRRRSLVPPDGPFVVEEIQAGAGAKVALEPDGMRILALVRGSVVIEGEPKVALAPGEFCLLPAALKAVNLEIETASDFLLVRPGGHRH
jgi:mannose-6-phosphate isomerase